MRRILPILVFAAACSTAAEHADNPASKPESAAGSAIPVDSGSAAASRPAAGVASKPASTQSTPTAGRVDTGTAPTVVRALYVNRWAAQSRKKMQRLIAVADTTEINALVIDMKDEFGLNYKSSNPAFEKNAGSSGKLGNVAALLDTLKAHRILAIARIVVFKDSVTARAHPEWTIRRTDGSIWRDHKGLAWVNPYHRELWDYNIGVAEELVKLGFGEIQFDYIRFPEPYKSLPQQVFQGAGNLSKPDAIAQYLKVAKERLNTLGVRSTADIFGLVTTVPGPLEVAQHWERVSPVTDVLLPMVYPSHYPRGSFGIPVPNADPYRVISIAISKARERDQKLGVTTPEHVRPWLQAFTLGKPEYGAAQIEAQKKAVYDSGYDGWVMWNPGSNYDVYLPALEKTLVSRKKS